MFSVDCLCSVVHRTRDHPASYHDNTKSTMSRLVLQRWFTAARKPAVTMRACGPRVAGEGTDQPAPYLVAGPAAMWQQFPQHPRHVRHGELGQPFPPRLLDRQQEGRGQQDEGDVVLPADPTPDLVLVDPGFALRRCPERGAAWSHRGMSTSHPAVPAAPTKVDPTIPRIGDAPWTKPAPILESDKVGPTRGRPRRDDRAILDGLIWLASRELQEVASFGENLPFEPGSRQLTGSKPDALSIELRGRASP